MIYLGDKAVGIATKIPVYEIYQSTVVCNEDNTQSISFPVENKPDAFIIGVMDTSNGTVSPGFYGCTAACGIWTNFQGGQYVGGRATGMLPTGGEDSWQVKVENINYDINTNTFTLNTGSPVRFVAGWTYRLSYYVSHRGGDT